MITTADDMIRALKTSRFAGVILWQGPSYLDNEQIVVIANRITSASDNAKTGAMVQTFIIRADVDPVTALATGQDASICGDCPHRPANRGSCYVNVGRSVRSVFQAFQRQRYAWPGLDYDPAILPDLFEGTIFRMGTYGDPAAAPFWVWEHATSKAAAVNGYTHQWRNSPEFAALCMASVDSADERAHAHALGFRTFRVRAASEPVEVREVVCPASKEAGQKTTCAACRACGGLSAKAKADVVILAHGATAKRFSQPIHA